MIFSKKEKLFLVLDIGTEAVKALLAKKEGGKTIILACSCQYFDKYSEFESADIEIEIIERALKNAFSELRLNQRKKIMETIVSLAPDILKARIIETRVKRADSEKAITITESKVIKEWVLDNIEQELKKSLAQEHGILIKDFNFLENQLITTEIDGYYVAKILKLRGKELRFNNLVVFCYSNMLDRIQGLLKNLGLNNITLRHLAQTNLQAINGKEGSILIDIGGEMTQIFVIKHQRLKTISEFNCGANMFSKALAEKLGLTFDRARAIKEKYSKKELSPETQHRIKELLTREFDLWFRHLQRSVRKEALLPQNIFLFGGGSIMEDIKDALEKENWKNVDFSSPPIVSIAYSYNLAKIENKSELANNPQFIPALLCLAKK